MGQFNNLSQGDQRKSWFRRNHRLLVFLSPLLFACLGGVSNDISNFIANVTHPKHANIITTPQNPVKLQKTGGYLILSDLVSFLNSGNSPGAVHDVEFSLTDTLLQQSFVFSIAFMIKGKSKPSFEAFSLQPGELKNKNLAFSCIDENFEGLEVSKHYRLDLKTKMIGRPIPEIKSFHFYLSQKQFRKLNQGKQIKVTLNEIIN